MKHVALALREINAGRKTGELSVRQAEIHKLLVFQDGGLIFAKTDVPSEKLGAALYRIGKLSKEMFDALPDVMKPGVLLGAALVERRIITQHDLYDGLIAQMEGIALNAFGLFDAQIEFVPRPRYFDEGFEFKLSLPLIIEDGIRAMPYHPSIREFLAGRRFSYRSQASVHLLTREEKTVLESLDGKKAGEALQAELGFKDEDFWKVLFLFYCLGMTAEGAARDAAEAPAAERGAGHPPGSGPEPSSPPGHAAEAARRPAAASAAPSAPAGREASAAEAKPAQVSVDEALSYKKIVADLDYYRVLGVTMQADEDVVKKAYFRLARKFHPDLFGRGIDPKTRHEIETLFDLITKAYRTLSNKELRAAYDNKPIARPPEEDPSKRADVRFRQGKTLFDQGRYEEAASLLEEAVRLRAKADYYLLLAMAETKVPALSRKAEQAFLKVVELEPWNAEGYVGLGLLYKQEGLMVKARRALEKAIEIEPEHTSARHELEAFEDKDAKKSLKDLLKMDLFPAKKK